MLLSRILTVLSLAATCSAQGLDIRLHQYDWPLSDGTLVKHSRAGGFELLFDDGDQQLLSAQGGGFVNISLLDNYTGEAHWLVRNLYLSFSSLEQMYEMPVVVPFGMGDQNGLPWGTSILATAVLPSPAARMPIDYIQVVDAVSGKYPFMIGGWIQSDGDSAAPEAADPNQVALDNQCGLQGPGGDPTIVSIGHILPVPGGVPAPSAGGMDCGPASVAGSIAYMGAVHGRAVGPVQDIFDGLKDCMNTDANGTTTGNLLAGKNEYTCEHELPICSEILEGHDWVVVVAEVLRMGGDVEVMYKRGDCSQPGTSNHIAMIRGISQFSDGTILVETMEPVTNADGTTSWVDIPIFFDGAGGLVADPVGGAAKGCLWGYFAEVWQGGCVCAP